MPTKNRANQPPASPSNVELIWRVPKRIAYVTYDQDQDHTPTRNEGLQQWANKLTDNGYSVIIFDRRPNPEVLHRVDENVRYVYLDTSINSRPDRADPSILRAGITIENALRIFKPSAVIGRSPWNNALPALLAAKKLGIPFLYEIYSFKDELSIREKMIAQDAHAIYANSPTIKQKFESLNIEPHRISLNASDYLEQISKCTSNQSHIKPPAWPTIKPAALPNLQTEPSGSGIKKNLLIDSNQEASNFIAIAGDDIELAIDIPKETTPVEINVKCRIEGDNAPKKPFAIALLKFFDKKGKELIRPRVKGLSWSKHLKCWYRYLEQSSTTTTCLNSISFRSSEETARCILHLEPWGATNARIQNQFELHFPSLDSNIPEEFLSIVDELRHKPVNLAIQSFPNRVCYVLNHSLPYKSEGYATRSQGIAQALREEGVDIICVSRPGFPGSFIPHLATEPIPNIDQIDGVEYQRITEPRGWRGTHQYINKAANELEKKFRELRPSAVLAASDFKNATPALLAAKRLGIPFIYEVRGFWEITHQSYEPDVINTPTYKLTRAMEAETAKQSDFVFTLTEAMRAELHSRGVQADKISLLPNSCNPNLFGPRIRDDVLADTLNIPKGLPVIGYIGTFNQYEGLDDLLYACGILRSVGRQFRVLLVGGESTKLASNNADAKLYKIAEECGFSDWLIMPGRVAHEEVGSYYSLIDIAAFPRKPQPVTEMVSPLKPLEALAMEKPIVVSSVQALAEMVHPNETGLIFEKGYIDDLAACLDRLICDAPLRKRLGSTGRKWVENERTWKKRAEDITQVLAKIQKTTTIASTTAQSTTKKLASEYKVALIADEFTFNSFKNEFHALPLLPTTWRETFLKERPDIFFCESAWSGHDSITRPWQGKIYASANWNRENRKTLLDILAHCKKEGVPTVFWNKEDPTHFGDKIHDFVRTATEFDFIFTTADECCEKYRREYGVKNVFSLPFATNPLLFNPIEAQPRSSKVVFAGSWYGNHEQRSKDMERILDNLIERNYEIEIYDRYFGSKDDLHRWPTKYQSFIKPGIPHIDMPGVYKSSTFGLNFNTVVDSSTMFARRVFELISSNTLVISNYSKGVSEIFGELVLFADRDLDRLSSLTPIEIDNLRERALDLVLQKHTYKHRWHTILDTIGLPHKEPNSSVTVVCIIESDSDAISAINYFGILAEDDANFRLLLVVSSNVPDLEVGRFYKNCNRVGIEVTSASFAENYALDNLYQPISTPFTLLIDVKSPPTPHWVHRARLHIDYLQDIAISAGQPKYQISQARAGQPIFGRTPQMLKYIFGKPEILATSDIYHL